MTDTQGVRPTDAQLHALGKQIVELAAYRNALEQRELALIREFDRWKGWALTGARTCAAWLSWRTGLKPGAARERVRVARKLEELPHLEELMRRGLISYSQARALTRFLTRENEVPVLEEAVRWTGAQLEKVGRQILRRVAVERNEPFAHVPRVLFEDLGNGVDRMTATMRGEQALLVRKGMDAIKREDPNMTDADALSAMAERSLGSMATDRRPVPGRWEGVIYVGARTLRLGELDAHERCELEGQTPISAETARRLLCDGSSVVVLVDAKGNPLDASRRRRTVSSRLRRLLLLRDKHCRFPGCTNKYYLDAHHIEHWAAGGKTNLANLVLLCRGCHVFVHEGGYRIIKRDGRVRFVGRDGRALPEGPRFPDLSRRKGDPVDRVKARETQVELLPMPSEIPRSFDYVRAAENILNTG